MPLGYSDPAFSERLHRDDGTEVVVEFTQGPYYPATGPSWDDPGSPAEGGEIAIVDVYFNGETIEVTEAERQRFYDELYRMPPHEYELDPDRLYEERRDDREWSRQEHDDPF